MQTFIPQGHKTTWSHSSLNTFDTCPRRYWAEKIAKNVKDDNIHPTTLWGLEVHKALEDNGKVNAPMPSNMKQYEGYAAALKSVTLKADRAYHEHQMAVDKNAHPVLWSSYAAYGRTIADVLVVSEKTSTAAIIDHKLGKYRGPSLQPVINAWMVMNHYNVEIVRTQFNYLAEDKSVRDVFYRTSIEHDFQPVRELIARLEAAVSYNNFSAIKSGLCRQYCPVHKCPHNGKFTP